MQILSYQWNDIGKLHIIYRLCDQRPNTYWGTVSKVECLNNFVQVFGKENLTIIADNMRAPEEIKKFDCNVIITNLGNSKTFAKALDLVRDIPDGERVYLVEDDYLHKPNAPKAIIEGLAISDFVTLYDHPDKYMVGGPNPIVINGGEQTKVYLTESTHWKETNSTTMTFAAKAGTIKQWDDVMRQYLNTPVPDDFRMWRRILQNTKLISSIPGLSTHCHSPWITPLWENK